MDRPNNQPSNPRRADLHLLLALLMLGAALAALLPGAFRAPAAAAPPPELAADLKPGGWAGLFPDDRLQPDRPSTAHSPMWGAVYRPDGGQALGPYGRLRPNDLSGLNLGRQIRLNQARPEQLAHLPGLGPNSAQKTRASGCLTKRQRQNLTGLVIEECDPNSP